MTRVLYAATLAPFTTARQDTSEAWLRAFPGAVSGADADVDVLAVLETDRRGLTPYAGVQSRVLDIGGTVHTFSVDNGATAYTTDSRLDRIVTGLNLIRMHAVRYSYDYVWYLHADTAPPTHALRDLLAVQWPIVGAHVPGYALDGPAYWGRPIPYPSKVPDWPYTHTLPRFPQDADIRAHMAPGACLLVHSSLSHRLPWRHDPFAGLTDDPAYHHDALHLYGVETLVRHDVVCRHYPEHLSPMENRYTAEQRKRW